ncbi:MAG: hypothetical protein RIM33_10040 [Alphaproteobacteria bacterium]
MKVCFAAIVMMLTAVVTTGPAGADNARHEGYYYPTPQTEERYRPRVGVVVEADRRTRIAFTTGLSGQMLSAPSPPRFAIFAKGSQAEKLIIVALSDGTFNTLYRIRALLAMLTAYSRSSPAFTQHPNPENLTFLDLIALIGFEQVVVTDGRELAHRIILDPNAP